MDYSNNSIVDNNNSIGTIIDSTYPVITNCWQPTWTGISLTSQLSADSVADITIRKLEKGFLVKFQGKEYAFEKLENIYKNIDKFYSKDKEVK